MIKIIGNAYLESKREMVWPRIFDPRSLMMLIPGCERLEQLETGEYRGKIRIGLASIGGSYDFMVKVLDANPPEQCRFEGEVSGPTGTVRGDATFTLQEVNTKSLIEYEANAFITGALAKLDPRFVEGVVKNLIKSGMARLNRQLQIEAGTDQSRQSSDSSITANRQEV